MNLYNSWRAHEHFIYDRPGVSNYRNVYLYAKYSPLLLIPRKLLCRRYGIYSFSFCFYAASGQKFTYAHKIASSYMPFIFSSPFLVNIYTLVVYTPPPPIVVVLLTPVIAPPPPNVNVRKKRIVQNGNFVSRRVRRRIRLFESVLKLPRIMRLININDAARGRP